MKVWVICLVGAIIFFSACSDDEGNNNTCNGTAAFAGVWNMVDQCGSSEFQYALTITENNSGIRLTNLGGLGPNAVVDATVSGSSFSFAQ